MEEERNDIDQEEDELARELDQLREDEAEQFEEDMKTDPSRHFYSAGDIVYDLIFFVITVAGAFAWMMMMLLFISFVSLSVLHFKLKYMILVSVLFAIAAAVYYIWKKIPKYRGHRFKSMSGQDHRHSRENK